MIESLCLWMIKFYLYKNSDGYRSLTFLRANRQNRIQADAAKTHADEHGLPLMGAVALPQLT